jgi:Tfp pilus assembly protein PilF
VLTVEAQHYPDYWNAFDSLGEMYARAGDKKLAIENYQKSVQLNPANHGGIEALAKLREASH